MGFGRLLLGFFTQVQITARFSLKSPAEESDHNLEAAQGSFTAHQNVFSFSSGLKVYSCGAES